MNNCFSRLCPLALGCGGMVSAVFQPAQAGVSPYPDWAKTASVWILTTSAGANLPAGRTVENFPVLVRLDQDFFPFAQAKPDGSDLRISSAVGERLPYEVESWDPAAGTANIWVLVPQIRGQDQQELRLHWGQPHAASASDGLSVFGVTNGFAGVWHLGETLRDATGQSALENAGTTPTAGPIGPARHLAHGQGLCGGEQLQHFPVGHQPHTSEAWLRAERPNGRVFGWGNEKAQGKVVMQFRSPPHIAVDAYFSDANAESTNRLPMAEWLHVAHTYENGEARIYVNGTLAGRSRRRASPLNIRRPARLYLGGWYRDYDFAGDLDEVRLSTVARSEDWMRLTYENQKPLGTLVGLIVTPGRSFSVAPTAATVREGQTLTCTAEAGGARKIYWKLIRAGHESVLAVDRRHFAFSPGRVSGHDAVTLRCEAVYADDVKTADIPVQVLEAVPEPSFRLTGPRRWDGRRPIAVEIHDLNAAAMTASGAPPGICRWEIDGIAVSREEAPGQLRLRRAHQSGALTIRATIDNGGAPTTRSMTIQVREPRQDPWVPRTPEREEMPVDHQFFARDPSGFGTVFCRGTLQQSADRVFLRVSADGQPYQSLSQPMSRDRTFTLAVKLQAGLIHYQAEFGYVQNGQEHVLHTATDLVCGDALILQGQSNAVATDWGEGDPQDRSEWIRTFGSMTGGPEHIGGWGNAVRRNPENEQFQIGYWGMELGRRWVEQHRMPLCLINGAVGGTRIDQHQPNRSDREDAQTIYGRLLWRVRQARLTHGIRGLFWYQGENDQGADGPTGGFGWETYRRFYMDLTAAWKQDFPNLQHFYVFQIWPKACAMGFDGSDNRLREVQRQLPSAVSHLHLMSTLGIDPPGGCHYPAAGYRALAELVAPLLERDILGKRFDHPITPPNVREVCFASAARNELLLVFDQPMQWDPAVCSQFFLDGQRGLVASGQAEGNTLRLKLTTPQQALRLTYLDGATWKHPHVLRGQSGIAALTFCDVAIGVNTVRPGSNKRQNLP